MLIACAWLAFGASLTGPFQFDDHSLLEDPAVTSPDGWWQSWRVSQTRPLTWFSFWLNYRLAGSLQPAAFHAVSLVLHCLATLLLVMVLEKLVPRPVALIAGGLFALHPIQAEAVCYIFSRGTLLATVLCLLSLRSWIGERYGAAAAWFAAALLAKEECAAFPVFLLLFNLSAGRSRSEWRWIGAMAALSVAAGLRVMYVAGQVEGSGAGTGAIYTPWEYFSAQSAAILRYFQLLLLPWGFTIDPEIPVPGVWLTLLFWSVLLAAAMFAISHFSRLRAGFWFLAGLVLLLPSSSIFPADDLAADRRLYLPLIAWSVLLALALARLKPKWLWGAAAVLMVLSFGRSQVWRSERALWEEAVRWAPSKVRPRIQLSRVVERQRGLEVLLEARSMAPENALVAGELARRYLLLGRPAQALPEFGRALALAPRDPLAHAGRGLALLLLGQSGPAKEDFTRALELDPCLFDARFNLLQLGVPTREPDHCRYTDVQRRALSQSP